MKYTIGTAAKATGKSKSTISRDIKNGKISAVRKENGSYEIDPAELHRVYAPVSGGNRSRNGSSNDLEPQENSNEAKALQREIDLLREHLTDKDNVIDDLRRRLDQEAEERRRLTLMLTHQQEPKADRKAPPGRIRRAWGALTGKA